MNRIIILTLVLLFSSASLLSQSITRMVFFNLKHEAGTPEIEAFIKNAHQLSEVPSVLKFEILKVEGKQFDYDYVICLVFNDRQGVEDYVKHAIHVNYLEDEWKPNVSGGMLIDLLDIPTKNDP